MQGISTHDLDVGIPREKSRQEIKKKDHRNNSI
jgi:hypothetical protein